MSQKLSICLVLFLLNQLWLETSMTRAQFMSSQLLRRKAEVAKKLLREIEGLELSIKNQSDLLGKKDVQQDLRHLKLANYSPQGRMVAQRGPRDYSVVDLNCDRDFDLNGLRLDSTSSSFSSRIECLNRDGDYTSRKQITGGQDKNEILKMKSNFEKLIDHLNAQRNSRGRRWI